MNHSTRASVASSMKVRSTALRAVAALSLLGSLLTLSLGGVSSAAALPSDALCASAQRAGGYALDVLPGTPPVRALTLAARHSFSLEMYELSDSSEISALIADAKRGVKVTVVLDRDYTGGEVNATAYRELADAHVRVAWGPASTIVHAKAAEADGTCALIGTGNLTPQYYSGTRDYWVADTKSPEVASIAQTIASDYSGTVHSRANTGNLLYSPGSETALVNLIASATTSVSVESEEMDEPYIETALEQAARRGVTCDVLMTANSEYDYAFSALTSAGCHVRLFPDVSSALYIHAKAVIVNAGSTSAKAFVGSENFSEASLLYDREIGLVLSASSARAVVSTLASTYARDFASATPYQ